MPACAKCGGLVVPGDYDGEVKCVNCSKRVYPGEGAMAMPERTEGDESELSPRCLARRGRGRCKRTAAPDCEGYCSEHVSQSSQDKPRPSSRSLPVPVKVQRIEVSMNHRSGNVLEAIDRALQDIELDRMALERAREILSRA